MKKGKIFVISGPSGCGKGTIVNLLSEKYSNAGVSVSATTRAPREGEAEGVSYYFITKEQFEEKIEKGEVLEYNFYNGNYYGTLKSEAERILDEGKDLILEIDVNGGRQIRSIMGDSAVLVMVLAPSAAVQEARLRGRGTETDDVIAGRMAETREEIKAGYSYDYILVNEEGRSDECADRFLSIINAEHSKSNYAFDVLDSYFNN